MLTAIKREIESERFEQNMHSVVLEAVANDSVRDLMLDSVDMDVIGAENDPEIESLLETIPEYDDTDISTEAELESMIESLTETTI